MAKIIGLGGVFFKSADPKGLAAWYRDTLGLAVQDWGGAMIKPDTDALPYTIWSPFSADTTYFAPSTGAFMLNFAIDDLDAFCAMLTTKGVEILGRSDDDSNGKFAWILDPGGNKIELWQPK
ncbi:MAG TPA: VOC family protein [Asticcacaulis sp.]|nr:VOC family protein [Asticcacaulis sp.]